MEDLSIRNGQDVTWGLPQALCLSKMSALMKWTPSGSVRWSRRRSLEDEPDSKEMSFDSTLPERMSSTHFIYYIPLPSLGKTPGLAKTEDLRTNWRTTPLHTFSFSAFVGSSSAIRCDHTVMHDLDHHISNASASLTRSSEGWLPTPEQARLCRWSVSVGCAPSLVGVPIGLNNRNSVLIIAVYHWQPLTTTAFC